MHPSKEFENLSKRSIFKYSSLPPKSFIGTTVFAYFEVSFDIKFSCKECSVEGLVTISQKFFKYLTD